MATIKYAENLSILRSIRKELLNFTNKEKNGTKSDPLIKHMLQLFRSNQVTEKRYCRPEHHYKYLANTYLTYLRSTRLQDEITKKYFNKGERSVQDSARLVGLELPKQQ